MLGVLVALLAIALVITLLPVRTEIALAQQDWQASVQVQVTVAWVIRLRRRVNLSEKVAMAAEHMLKRWRATGEPVKVPLQKSIRRYPRRRVLRAALPPIRFFRRRVRVQRLDLHLEVGGFDAMQSALLSGVAWSLIGVSLAQASRLVELDPALPRIDVVPVFTGPACRTECNCILGYRLGNAIFAGVWLLARALRDREIRTWARESWRRKGEEGGGRASDSGLNENGHGEPQEHGRR